MDSEPENTDIAGREPDNIDLAGREATDDPGIATSCSDNESNHSTDDSDCPIVPKTKAARPQRQVVVIGKKGAGKRTLINQVIKEADCNSSQCDNNSNQWTVITKEDIYLTIYNIDVTYDSKTSKNIAEAKKLFTETLRTQMNDDLQDINLIVLVFRQGYFTREEKEIFETLTQSLTEEACQICVLVLTGCEDMSEMKRKQLVEEYKMAQETSKIIETVPRVFCVGFPTLENVRSNIKEAYPDVIARDQQQLLELISSSKKIVSRESMLKKPPGMFGDRSTCILS